VVIISKIDVSDQSFVIFQGAGVYCQTLLWESLQLFHLSDGRHRIVIFILDITPYPYITKYPYFTVIRK
jgi:hypothetical protein